MQHMLSDRNPEPESLNLAGVSVAMRDLALESFCQAFDIAESDRYRLRLDDEPMKIYRALTTGRHCDGLQFERLALNLNHLPSPAIALEDVLKLATIADLIRCVADRHGRSNESTHDGAIRSANNFGK
ncbi:MAG: hypothetical protein GC162_19060 [Planctomycetes bacterium]|nr:hypothetical protein [Planctomycetota bacterium]